MIFLGVMVAIFAFYLWVRRLSYRLPLGVKNLLQFKVHYFLIGVIFGAVVPDEISLPLQETSGLVLGLLIGWIGFVFGTGLDLRIIRKIPSTGLIFSLFQAIFTFLVVLFFSYWATSLVNERSLKIALAFAAITSTTAVLPLRFEAKGKVTNLLRSIFFGNLIAVIALGWIFCIYGSVTGGWGERLALSLGIGVLTGVLTDFFLRKQMDSQEATFLLFAVVLFGSGLAVAFDLSSIFVGMVAGAWLINSTLRRVPLLEIVQGRGSPLEGIFLGIVGSVLGAGPLRGIKTILVSAVLLLLFRGIGKTVGANLGARLFVGTVTTKGRDLLGLGLLSQGCMAVAIALQISQQLKGTAESSILPIAVLAIIFNQLIAPYGAITALRRAEELKLGSSGEET